MEIWKDIEGYEGLYQVSNFGRVKSVKRGILVPTSCGRSLKYRKVGLIKNGIRHQVRVHKLVWISFVGPVPEGYEINHRDENPNNNALSNLELLTRKENINYGTGRIRLEQVKRMRRQEKMFVR